MTLSRNVSDCLNSLFPRRQVHANKLFYCDVCGPGDKGYRGFEKFADVVKHVARENGIHHDDWKNLHELIRIPEQADSLKIFRCMFCPGEGMMFVGLSEETFLEHALRRHGEKVTRCRPEKLRRECRICGLVAATDTELGDHIKREHIRQRNIPFAGFGPKCFSDSDSETDREESPISSSVKISRGKAAPPPPPTLRLSSRSPTWQQKTEKFIRKTARGEAFKRRRDSKDSSDDEKNDLRSSLELVKSKRMRLEGRMKEREETKKKKEKKEREKKEERKENKKKEKQLKRCLLCRAEHQTGPDMWEHLATHHTDSSFSCSRAACAGLAWPSLAEAARHVKECRHLEDGEDQDQLLARGHIRPPSALECVYCNYCSPEHMIVASSWVSMENNWFDHMEQHEKIHKGNMNAISSHTSYGCRLCDKRFKEKSEMEEHIQSHKRESRARSRRKARGRPEDGEVTRSSSTSEEVRNVPEQKKEECVGKVSCKYCNTSWPGDPEKAVLRQHREQHSDMITSINDCFQRECRVCHFVSSYGEFRSWLSHVSSAHDKPSKVKHVPEAQCSYCYEWFRDDKLRSHIREVHVKEAFQCGNCPELFSIKSEVLSHMEKQHKVNSVKAEALISVPNTEKLGAVSCQLCQWDALGGDDLEMGIGFHLSFKHKSQDTSRVQYFCRICGKEKAFRDSRRLMEHVKEHSRETRAGREDKSSKDDWNRNYIRNINNHLTSGYTGDDRRHQQRERDNDNQDRRSRNQYEDRRSVLESDRRQRRDDLPPRRSEESSKYKEPRARASDEPKRYGDSRGFGDFRGRGSSRGGRGGGFSQGGRGGGGRGRGSRGEGRGGGRHQDRGEDWRCGGCGYQNFADRKECKRCQQAKSDTPQPSAMDETRNTLAEMMRQYQDGISAVNFIIEDILEVVVQSREKQPNDSPDMPDMPDSPSYVPPDIESEDEDYECYECTECQLRKPIKFDLYFHLETDHGISEDEEVLNSKVKGIKRVDKTLQIGEAVNN